MAASARHSDHDLSVTHVLGKFRYSNQWLMAVLTTVGTPLSMNC